MVIIAAYVFYSGDAGRMRRQKPETNEEKTLEYMKDVWYYGEY
jgi:hypothetical protein